MDKGELKKKNIRLKMVGWFLNKFVYNLFMSLEKNKLIKL